LHAHYDLQSESYSDGNTVTSLTDQSGNGRPASAVGSPTFEASGFNGLPSAVCSGEDDGWVVSSSDWDTLTQPYTFYAVMELLGSSDGRFWYSSLTGVNFDWSGSNWRYFAGTPRTGSTDNTVTDFAILFDSPSSILEEQGTQTDSGDIGTNDAIGNVGISHNPDGSQFQHARYCELLWYDASHDSATRTDVRNYFVNRWSL
jgi:hypothetical protein